MSETTLPVQSPAQIPLLFGVRDANLRRIRDLVGIDVYLRNGQVHVKGTEEQIHRGLEIFTELRRILEQQGRLLEADVVGVIGKHDYDGVGLETTAIDLHERARKITPRTAGQAAFVQSMREHDLVFCVGPAGSGKTYLAVAMAVNSLREERVHKIVLVRPAVEAGEKLGFLPGDILAKVNPFLRPLLDALHDMLDYDQVSRYMDKDVIEIVPLAFMRGRTLNNTFIILDEGQNTTTTQMKMFLTRMGTGSRIVVTGDTTQVDLPSNVMSGLTDAIERLQGIAGVGAVRLTGRDIVRHRLVREIVKAYDDRDEGPEGEPEAAEEEATK